MQGCNCAFESARVLADTLDKVGLERLEQLPAAFSAARVRDAHALQDMDFNTAVRGSCVCPALLKHSLASAASGGCVTSSSHNCCARARLAFVLRGT